MTLNSPKFELKDENDQVVGYKWILGEYVEPSSEPPTPPEPPTPDPDPPIVTPDPDPEPPVVILPIEPEVPPAPPISPHISVPQLSTSAKLINTLLSS